jgi:hypothetical protein
LPSILEKGLFDEVKRTGIILSGFKTKEPPTAIPIRCRFAVLKPDEVYLKSGLI